MSPSKSICMLGVTTDFWWVTVANLARFFSLLRGEKSGVSFQSFLDLFGARRGKLGCARMFVKQYLELRRSFEIYSGVASMCIVLLIVEVYAVLFCFLSAWCVYYKELPPAAFTRLSFYIYTSVTIILLLIELGHYMDTKVR